MSYEEFHSQLELQKHIAAETMFYASIALVGNAFFAKKAGSDEKSCCLVKAYKGMPKKQKCFNHLLLGCYAVDMTVSYLLLKGLKKITK